MEDDLPLPMPDRRIFTTENNLIQSTENSNSNNYNIFKDDSNNKTSDLKESKLSVMSAAQIMQIEDMRQKILSFNYFQKRLFI